MEIDEARLEIKKIAGRMLARKEALEAELAKLEREHERIPGEELEQLIAMKRDELSQAEADLQGAIAEYKDLAKVGDRAERDALMALVESAGGKRPDPLDRAAKEAKAKLQLEELKRKKRERDGTPEPAKPAATAASAEPTENGERSGVLQPKPKRTL